MKKLGTILFLLLCSMSIYAQKVNETAVKEDINKVVSSVRSMQCDFVQTKQLKMLNEKMVSQGRMYYQQGNKLRWEYTSPYTYTFILNNSQVVLKKNDRKDIIDVNQNNIFKEIVRIMMSCVTGKALTDERDFEVSISESSNEWIAQMTPQRKELKKLFQLIVLHADKRKSMVTSVELQENNGDKTLIELKNIQINTSIDAKMFDVN